VFIDKCYVCQCSLQNFQKEKSSQPAAEPTTLPYGQSRPLTIPVHILPSDGWPGSKLKKLVARACFAVVSKFNFSKYVLRRRSRPFADACTVSVSLTSSLPLSSRLCLCSPRLWPIYTPRRSPTKLHSPPLPCIVHSHPLHTPYPHRPVASPTAPRARPTWEAAADAMWRSRWRRWW